MSVFKRLTLVCCLLASISCHRKEVGVRLDEVRTFVSERPDSAMTILDSLHSSGIRGRENRAKYALLYAIALDKLYIDETDDSLVSIATEWYGRHGSPDDRLKAFYYHGRVLQNAGDDEKAMEYFVMAEKFGNEAKDWFYRGMLSLAKANIWNNAYNIDDEIVLTENAFQCFNKAEKTDYAQMALLYKGVALTNAHRYDEADAIYDSVLSYSQQYRDTVLIINSLLWQATNELNRENSDYESVSDKYESVLNRYRGTLSFSDYCGYAEALYHIAEREQALQLISALSSYEMSTEDKVKYYNLMYRIRRLDENLQSSLEYLELSTALQDSIVQETLAQSVLKEQRNYFEKESIKASNKNKIRGMLLVIISISILFICSLFYFFIRRLLQKQEVQKITLLESVNLYASRTEQTERKLQEIRANFKKAYKARYQSLADLYEITVYVRHDIGNSLQRRARETVERFMKDVKPTDKLEKMIDSEMDGIISKLRREFPKMRQRDIDLLIYKIIGLSPFIIANLLDTAPNNIYSREFRLKEKITKSTSPDKEMFLEMIF